MDEDFVFFLTGAPRGFGGGGEPRGGLQDPAAEVNREGGGGSATDDPALQRIKERVRR
jgi:hypothetical protein